MQGILILLTGDLVLLLEVLDFVFTLLKLTLQRTAYLALRGQFVVGLLLRSFQHHNQGICGVNILLGQHLRVYQDIPLFFHILDIILFGGNRERERAIGLSDHSIATLDLNRRPGNALARDNSPVTAPAPFGLYIALLSLRRCTQRQH